MMSNSRLRIEERLIRKDSRERASDEINKLVAFQRIVATMQQEIHQVITLFIGFWKELENESPNFQYLKSTSYNIIKRANKVRLNYQTLISINPGNMYCRILYALFLKKVMKDEYEAFDVHEEYCCSKA